MCAEIRPRTLLKEVLLVSCIALLHVSIYLLGNTIVHQLLCHRLIFKLIKYL